MILRSYQICAIYTPVLIPCLAVRFWLKPCEPYAPGFWILDECTKNNDKLWNFFTLTGSIATIYWLFFCLLFTWALTKLLANDFFVLYQFVFVIAACIKYYLDNILVHVGNPRKELSNLEMIRVYRRLQLMMRFFNGVNQNYFIPILLFAIGVAYVIPAFAFISLKGEMSIPQFVIMGSAIGQVVICLFGCGIFGGIYENSSEALHAFRKKNFLLESKKERKICSKFVQSFAPMKVMIGSVNFVDKLTPITLFDYFLGILVDLLLLK